VSGQFPAGLAAAVGPQGPAIGVFIGRCTAENGGSSAIGLFKGVIDIANTRPFLSSLSLVLVLHKYDRIRLQRRVLQLAVHRGEKFATLQISFGHFR